MFKVGDFVIRKSEPTAVFVVIAVPLGSAENSVLLRPVNIDSWWTCSHPDNLEYAEPEHLL